MFPLMDALSGNCGLANRFINEERKYKKEAYLLTSEPIGNFLVDPARVTIEGADGTPVQIIGKATHVKGVECYVARYGKMVSDQDIVKESEEIFDRLTREARRFAIMDYNGELGAIHELVGRYQSAPDITALHALRAEFTRISNQFPEIPENLRQIELAAAWDWVVKRNPTKPTNTSSFLNIILDENFYQEKFKPGSVNMQLPQEGDEYK